MSDKCRKNNSFREMFTERCPDLSGGVGVSGLTVNQPPYGFEGSSPSSPTILLRAKALRRICTVPDREAGCPPKPWRRRAVRMHYVYLLQSERFPDQRYVGVTADLKKRLPDHNAGKSPHTSKYTPWKLVTYVAFSDAQKAKTSSFI